MWSFLKSPIEEAGMVMKQPVGGSSKGEVRAVEAPLAQLAEQDFWSQGFGLDLTILEQDNSSP